MSDLITSSLDICSGLLTLPTLEPCDTIHLAAKEVFLKFNYITYEKNPALVFKASKTWILIFFVSVLLSYMYIWTYFEKHLKKYYLPFWEQLHSSLLWGVACLDPALKKSTVATEWFPFLPLSDSVGLPLTPSPLWHTPASKEQPGFYLKAIYFIMPKDLSSSLSRGKNSFLKKNVLHHFNRI